MRPRKYIGHCRKTALQSAEDVLILERAAHRGYASELARHNYKKALEAERRMGYGRVKDDDDWGF